MSSAKFDPAAAARYIAEAHAQRQPYQNMPEAIAPKTVADAYAAQEALRPIWEPIYGPVAGLKIATRKQTKHYNAATRRQITHTNMNRFIVQST